MVNTRSISTTSRMQITTALVVGPADFFSPSPRREAFVAAHRRDDHAEDHALDTAAGQIP